MNLKSRAVRRTALAVGVAALAIPGTAAVATTNAGSDNPGSNHTTTVAGDSADKRSTSQAMEVTREFYAAYVAATNKGDEKKAEQLRERYLGDDLNDYVKEWREKEGEDYVLRSEAPTKVKNYGDAVDQHEVKVTFAGDSPQVLSVRVDPETKEITQITERIDSAPTTVEPEDQQG